MIKVLFVCLGNICRSPLAQGIMEKKIREAGLEKEIEIDSCGTSQYHIGEQPDNRTLRNARQHGLTIDHAARQFSATDFEAFDYIVFMDQSNFEAVRDLDEDKSFSDKLYLMRDFDTDEKGADVPDPFFGGEEGFQHVYEILERSVAAFLNHLAKDHNLKQRVG